MLFLCRFFFSISQTKRDEAYSCFTNTIFKKSDVHSDMSNQEKTSQDVMVPASWPH